MTRVQNRLMGRVLALALLFAQFGAGIHAYTHSLADPAESLGAARSCEYCLASAQLQIAVGSSAPTLPAPSLAWVTIVPEPGAFGSLQAPFRAFRSRAPPALV